MPGQEPSFVNMSLRQMPHACTLMRTCPEVGLGISRSMIWKSAPGLETCASFIVATETIIVAIHARLLAADTTHDFLLSPRMLLVILTQTDNSNKLEPSAVKPFCFLDLVGPFFQNDSKTEAVQARKVPMVSRKLRA